MDEQAKAEAEAKAGEGEKAADEPAKDEGAAASSNGAAGSTAQAAPSSSGSGSGGSSSGGSSSGASSAPSQQAHTHTWVPVTSQQWRSNPVSVWVQDSAAWDEPVYSGTYWCNTCGCAVSVNHVKETMLAGQGHSVTTKNIQTDTVHHDATGHYETQDQGWYETVTTGYQCSGCGAWQ